MATFAGKEFNAEVFMKYLETVPRIKQNAFLKAGIFRQRGDIASAFKDQTGGNYVTIPMVGLIGGTPENYDGNTNLTADTIDTYSQSMIVVGRAHGWSELDFSYELTKKDFFQEIAKQVGAYYDDVDQTTILAILEGIFASTDSKTASFVSEHTYDITAASNPKVDATTLNNAIQKASGANKNIFTLAIMHSQVATNLENLQLLDYAKGVDANGVEKSLALATWNGRTVMIDDDVPFDSSSGAYTTFLLGRDAFDYLDCGAKVPVEPTRDAVTKGGQDFLWTRQRKLFAPRGISFVQPSSAIMSPTDAQLKTGARWKIVQNANGALDHRAIPIAQIKSLG